MTQFETGEERSPSIPHEALPDVRGDLVLAERIRKAPLSKFGTVRGIRRAFSNWYAPVLLLALEMCLRVRHSITWRSRSGTTFVTRGDGSHFPVREIFVHDEYCLDLLRPAPMTIVDVGANVGVFSLRAAELFRGVRIVACEASPWAYEQLVRNVELNPALCNIDTRHCAVVGSLNSRDIDFWMDATASASSTLLESAIRDESAGQWVKVPAVSLSAVLASVTMVDLLKVDVEGAEYEILQATPASVLAQVRRIVVEYHPLRGHHVSDIVALLVLAGFRLERHHEFIECPGIGMLWFDRALSPSVPG